MPDQKISDLTAATVIEATDHFVVSRGSSNLKVPGSLLITSWELANETWTYASSTTFTVSGDVTAKYSKGTKIKLTQTTVKYFVVTDSSHSTGTTTVTITGGTSYTFSNAAVTDNYYSYLVNPEGFPLTFNYTPTWSSDGTAPVLNNGTITANFSAFGRQIQFWISLQMGSTTTYGSGIWNFTTPTTISGNMFGNVWMYDNVTAEYIGQMAQVDGTKLTVRCQDGATVNYLGASNPHTWANLDQMSMVGIYLL